MSGNSIKQTGDSVASVDGDGNEIEQSGGGVVVVRGSGARIRQSITPMIVNRGRITGSASSLGLRVNGRPVAALVENTGLINIQGDGAVSVQGGAMATVALSSATDLEIKVNDEKVDMDSNGLRDWRVTIESRPAGTQGQWVSKRVVGGQCPQVIIKTPNVLTVTGNNLVVDARKGTVGSVGGVRAHVVASKLTGDVQGAGCTVVTKQVQSVSGAGNTVHKLEPNAYKAKEREVVSQNKVTKRAMGRREIGRSAAKRSRK